MEREAVALAVVRTEAYPCEPPHRQGMVVAVSGPVTLWLLDRDGSGRKRAYFMGVADVLEEYPDRLLLRVRPSSVRAGNVELPARWWRRVKGRWWRPEDDDKGRPLLVWSIAELERLRRRHRNAAKPAKVRGHP